MTLGNRLHDARKLTGVTGADLGIWAGLSRGTVSMIESGSRLDPSGTTVAALARVLGISADWLLTGTGEAPTREQMVAATEAAKVAWEAAESAKGAADKGAA